MSANRQYKSSVFSILFGEPKKFIELYNALTGSSYPLDTKAVPATLMDVLFMDRMNDVAFVIGDTIVVLIEHQSSHNEKMPLRLLLYIARVYELLIDNKTIYKEKLQKIPKPEFIVLYNGTDSFPDEKALKLSDAFKQAPPTGLGGILELTVRVVNINKGYNNSLVGTSSNLKGYIEFIDMVRQNQQDGLSLDDAVEKAVSDCLKQGILVDFMKRHSSEVMNMLTAEFDIDIAKQVWQEEAREDGFEKGRAEAREEERRKTLQKTIKGVVAAVKNWHVPLSDAMANLGLENEYREQVIAELQKQGIVFTE
jgi:hypothetical protein